jgi:hypothetical protein
LKKPDDFYPMTIEHALSHDDSIGRSELHSKLRTLIRLDECIRAARHAQQAVKRTRGILQAGIGRAHHIALATLPNFGCALDRDFIRAIAVREESAG